MIHACVQANTGDGRVEQHWFDATPWFEQASPQQLNRLASERQTGKSHGHIYIFYSGEQTDDIWGWMVETFADNPEVKAFMDYCDLNYCDLNDSGWSCELTDGREVDSWLLR